MFYIDLERTFFFSSQSFEFMKEKFWSLGIRFKIAGGEVFAGLSIWVFCNFPFDKKITSEGPKVKFLVLKIRERCEYLVLFLSITTSATNGNFEFHRLRK